MSERLTVQFQVDLSSDDQCKIVQDMFESLSSSCEPRLMIKLAVDSPDEAATRQVAMLLSDLAAAKNRSADRKQPNLWQEPE